MERVTKNIKDGAIVAILFGLSFCHLLNDMMQSLIVAIYPLLKESFHLDFSQIGLITLVFQLTASLLQPLVGHYTDRHPKPYVLTAGMGFTLIGLLLLSQAASFSMVLLSVALVGVGSSVFHPESSRIARLASGGRHGFAQSLFQVGGNAGQAIGPLLVALFVLPRGRGSIAWFSLAALLAVVMLVWICGWYKQHSARSKTQAKLQMNLHTLSRRKVIWSIVILIALMFSKFFYMVSISSYYIFYLIGKFHISVQSAQLHLFIFLGAVAVGTMAGGHIGDRIGRKRVIWGSILGVLPFTLVLPYADLFWTGILSAVIGLILSSAFSAILVYAQELVPGRVGMVAGLFFGIAFGIAGIGAALLGKLADMTSIATVYHVCSFLPLIGLLAGFLPEIEKQH